MQGDWTNEFTLKFLEHYSQEQLLWDTSHKNHKVKHKVRDAWKRISAKTGNLPIDTLKTKKKSLMATFRPLLKKKKASMLTASEPDDVFQPVWFAYEMMESFLGKIYDLDETIKIEDKDEEDEIMTLLPLPPPSPSTSIQSQPSVEIWEPSTPRDNSKNCKATKIESVRLSKEFDDSMADSQKRFHESFDTLVNVLNKKRVEEDECDIYGKLLAKRLRKYPERMRNRIMYKIDGLLLDNPPDEL